MHVTKTHPTPTSVKLVIAADAEQLVAIKQQVVKHMAKTVKVQGFRPGKAPQQLVEKQIDQQLLQSEFMEQAVNKAYVDALRDHNLRPTAQPQITITKFVPFDTLEFTADFDAIGKITLADYTKIKLAKKPVSVTKAQIDAVMADLKGRVADKKDVDRAVKNGDQATLDFAGVDAVTKEPIAGADGKAYPLLIGSNSFIPGFEEQVIGVKPGATKIFDITFPKDYTVQALQNRKVSFTITVHSVQEVIESKLDNAFAAKIGPFKTMDELTADIKKQLQSEAETQAQRNYENELLEQIAAKSQVAVPTGLVEDEVLRLEEEEKRNLVYRGQTWQEHLDDEGETDETHRAKNRKPAEARVQAGLILGEIAEREGINVSPEEIEMRVMALKGQYTDVAMQAELDKPENRQDIAGRMLTEKTIDYLASLAQNK